MRATKDHDAILIGKNIKGVKYFAGYIRVSTKKQAEVQHGSPEQQKHLITRWMKRFSDENDVQISLSFIQEEMSGVEEKLHKRPGFQRIVHAIQTRSVDGVIAEKLDRFGRGNYLIDFVKTADKNNVLIIEAESGAINLKDKNSRMGLTFKTWWATEYSLDLQEKIPKKQREARVNNGKDTSTVPCLGLDAHPTKTGKYVNNQKEGKQVFDIAQRCIELGGICKELELYCEKKGYKTKVRWTREKIDKEGTRIPPRKMGGQTLTIKRLHCLLTNRKLRGTGRFLDSWNQFPKLQDEMGYVEFKYTHDPVIPPEVFDKIQITIKEKAKKNGRSGANRRVYLLSGVFETNDGRRFQGGTANSGKNPYYQTKERDILIPKEKIEKFVLDRVKKYIKESGTLENLINTALKHRLTGLPLIDEEIQEIKQNISTLQATVNGFTQGLREMVLQKPTQIAEIMQTLIVEKQKAELELEQANRHLDELQSKRDYVSTHFKEKTLQEYIGIAMKKFDAESPQAQKQIIQNIIPKIIYYHEEKRLELHVRPQPPAKKGQKKSPNLCHSGGNILRVSDKWRTFETRLEEFSATLQLLDSIKFSHTPPHKDKDFLHQKYIVEGLSAAQISSQIFSSKTAVLKGLKDVGIETRAQHENHGNPSQPRYGYRLQKGKPVRHLAESRVIKAVDELRSQGLSLRQIAKFLDQIGVPTKCRGKKWHPEMVKRLLAISNTSSQSKPLAPNQCKEQQCI